MKHLFQSFMLTLVVTFTFSACSKEQMNQNKLKGSWKLTSQTQNGNPIPITTAIPTYTFDSDCKIEKETCSGSATYTDGTSFTFAYTIQDGNKLDITVLGEKTIKSLTSKKLVLRYVVIYYFVSTDNRIGVFEETYTKQ